MPDRVSGSQGRPITADEIAVQAMKVTGMGLTEREQEWGAKASRFLKAELKRAGIGYKELTDRLNRHGLQETETSITGKLARGTFAASFFFSCLAALEMEGVQLADL
jgi:hypothetical protein